MAAKFAGGVIATTTTTTAIMMLLVIASMQVRVCQANAGWYGPWPWWNGTEYNCTDAQTPKKINVGGSNNWTFGFDYATWARRNGPFYVNDTLVFRYDPPSETNTHPHSVYEFPNIWSFYWCDIKKATMVANTSDGNGDGFEFVLTETWKWYYFACGARNGLHCSSGKMRFSVLALPRPYYRC